MTSHLKIYALLTLFFSFISPDTDEQTQNTPLLESYTQLEAGYAKNCYSSQFDESEQKSLIAAAQKNLPQSMVLKKLEYKEPLPAYDKAVLISMVKDEADIIAENLAWHHFMGFRKFIIIDNGSTDATRQLIATFKESTASSTQVIIIDDPRVLYLQTSRTNACIRLAEKLFPEILWIFPNDADEFIMLNKSLEETLSSVSDDINCIYSPRITYIPTDDFFTKKKDAKFYEKIHIGHKRNPYGYPDDSPSNGKSFIRAHQGLLMVKGNHSASNTSATTPRYISGLDCDLHIREFPLRSPEHALRKIINLGVAEVELKMRYPNFGYHYYAYRRLKRFGEIGSAVGLEEFRTFMTTGGYSFDEAIPIKLALESLVNHQDSMH